MADEAIVTQALVETVYSEDTPEVRATQVHVESIIGQDIAARGTAAHLEILINGTRDEDVILPETTYSSVDLPDPSTYYMGFKQGRVLSFGTATRALSDLTGQWSANDVTISLADTDRSVRGTLSQAKVLRETPVVIRMISDADRRARLVPNVVFRGALRKWTPRGDLAVDLEYTDAVGLKLSRRGNDRNTPSRTVTVADFPNAPADSQGKPIPIIYGIHEHYGGDCPLLYVGLLDVGMGEMHTWVVAGHACVEVDLFLDGVMLYTEPPFGTTWFCPPGQGEPVYSGWSLATTYVDINGRRYTVVQGRAGLTITGSEAADTLTATDHGLLDGDIVRFSTSKLMGTHTLPSPLRESADYYVCNKTDDTFQVSETIGGAVIDLTTNGEGTFKFDTDPDVVVAGAKTLTANVYGIEATGDGTGMLISQSFLQYLHFFQQFVLRDYQNGDWPTDSILWETGWCQINAQSFVTAQLESRRWVSGSGYEGQAYIGPESRPIRDVLASWNTSLNCRLGLNRYHQWTVSVLPGALDAEDIAALPVLTDAQDVLKGTLSFDMEGMERETVTRVTVSAFKVPKESGVYAGVETYRDALAEVDADDVIGSELFLDFLPAATPTTLSLSAEDVAKRWLAFRTGSTAIYRVTFQAGICAYEAVDVGELFRFTHFAGTTSTGYVNRILWCESMALDIDQRSVTITALDVTHVYEGERTLEEIIDPPEGEVPPIESESALLAPTGLVASLIDAAAGSAYYGNPGAISYYKLVAVFDSGEESKPCIIGPITTDSDGGSNIRKRVHLIWNAYPTGTQTSPSGATVTPVGMRLYRSELADFSVSQQMNRELYPIPEQPANFSVSSRSGSGTTYYYWVRQYYYLSGVSEDMADITADTSETADVDMSWDADPVLLQVGRGTPPDYGDGVFIPQVFGRTDSAYPGHAGRYLTLGIMDSYHDDGRDTEKGGGGIEPFPDPPTGSDIPLTGTSFYDQWPGKKDEANNPWESL